MFLIIKAVEQTGVLENNIGLERATDRKKYNRQHEKC